MFWKFGGYANISPIDAILDRPDFTLEELLDEGDLLGDVKAHNNKLLEFLRQKDIVLKLLAYVVAPKAEPVAGPPTTEETERTDSAEGELPSEPPEEDIERGRSRIFGRSRASSSVTDGGLDEEDEAEKKRMRYAFVSCEILASDNWSICDTLLDPANRAELNKFWEFLKRPSPLDPLQASYFTKVNESLFDKKVEDMVNFLKGVDGAVQDMLRHVDCPMVMDLLLKIITLDRPEAYQGIVEWLYTQDIMPTLLAFLSPENSWATQTSAGDFIKAIITVSANATQHEQTCIGPNELTRQLVSHPCIDELIGYMLKGGNALTVGVGIVIEVIRKNNSDYDPDVGTEANSIPSSRDPIYLGTLLRMFAQNVPNFMQLMNNAPAQKSRLNSTFGEKIEPLGFDRFKTCELMAELLHCSNMGLLNEVGSEELIAARDAQRKRLREEGKLTGTRGEEANPSNTDLLTMSLAHTSPTDEGRRLEVTNVSAADEDGFEEVTHAAGLGEDEPVRELELPSRPAPASGSSASPSFMDKDEDDFVEEPLSSPRLKTNDEKIASSDDQHFDDPELLVAPLSPSKRKSVPVEGSTSGSLVPVPPKDDPAEGSDDFVTEATEPALGDEAKRMVPDLEKGDDSDSSIMFTPTISSLSSRRSPSPTTERTVAPTDEVMANTPETPSIKTEENTEGRAESGTPTTTPPTETPAIFAHEIPTEPKQVQDEKEDAKDAASNGDAEMGFGDASIIVTQQPSEAGAAAESAPGAPVSDPVVGDFLKMQFVDHRVVPTILSFFFSYPWNNFLHNVVYDVVQQVFNGPMDRGFNPHLAISLFESADITTQIVNGQLVSEQSQAATRMRMGYMGHLTLIAEEVVKFTERHPAELLSETVVSKIMSPDWTNYIDGTLTETRERDNATLGGVRPEVAMGNHAAAAGLAAVGLSGLGSSLTSLGLSNSQGTSNALAEAGLNGSLDLNSDSMDLQGSNDGHFSISAGISSGFHSSSDEEDDDADDNDEDINNEVSISDSPLQAYRGVRLVQEGERRVLECEDCINEIRRGTKPFDEYCHHTLDGVTDGDANGEANADCDPDPNEDLSMEDYTNDDNTPAPNAAEESTNDGCDHGDGDQDHGYDHRDQADGDVNMEDKDENGGETNEPSGAALQELFSDPAPIGLRFNGTGDIREPATGDAFCQSTRGRNDRDDECENGVSGVETIDRTDYDNLPQAAYHSRGDFQQRAQNATDLVLRLRRTVAQRFRRG
ncbi:SIT4-associating protein SAP190 [Sporothrix schenckii 1099-18]|uniref:SIT4-associating protein SAP190 n=1 Tax=Sporothrix schenckii 1099-18 TaxID=1397361 RepID=A0A0F2M7U4_SPOSC|nr:SIT4-associating protein SAP190 [Sporothrix schenckii 1099-18]KJR84246.1 SIT4-associating protein SAP190 [Sporothrix schenckii 1099-18]